MIIRQNNSTQHIVKRHSHHSISEFHCRCRTTATESPLPPTNTTATATTITTATTNNITTTTNTTHHHHHHHSTTPSSSFCARAEPGISLDINPRMLQLSPML